MTFLSAAERSKALEQKGHFDSAENLVRHSHHPIDVDAGPLTRRGRGRYASHHVVTTGMPNQDWLTVTHPRKTSALIVCLHLGARIALMVGLLLAVACLNSETDVGGPVRVDRQPLHAPSVVAVETDLTPNQRRFSQFQTEFSQVEELRVYASSACVECSSQDCETRLSSLCARFRELHESVQAFAAELQASGEESLLDALTGWMNDTSSIPRIRQMCESFDSGVIVRDSSQTGRCVRTTHAGWFILNAALPADAVVHLSDAEAVRVGPTRWAVTPDRPVQVVIQATNHLRWEAEFTVGTGGRLVWDHIKLVPLAASVRFEIYPTNTDLMRISGATGALANGESHAVESGALQLDLPPGRHLLRFESTGQKPIERIFDLAPGESVAAVLHFLPVPDDLVLVTTTSASEIKNAGLTAFEPDVVAWLLDQPDFWITRTEITAGEFAEFRGQRARRGMREPAVGVSVEEAVQFANWRSDREGLTPCYVSVSSSPEGHGRVRTVGLLGVSDCNGYRLPSSAEWEYAATYLSERRATELQIRLSSSQCSSAQNRAIRRIDQCAEAYLGSLTNESRALTESFVNATAEWVLETTGSSEATLARGLESAGRPQFRIHPAWVSCPDDLTCPVGEANRSSANRHTGFRLVRTYGP